MICPIKVSDPALNDSVIQTFSGSVLVNTIVYSTNNTMDIVFSTDDNIFMSGFHLSWFLASPPVALDTTTPLQTAGPTGAQINTGKSNSKWMGLSGNTRI